jgi:sulfur relay (sulfurtransferase) complex TusBCD TusD component (DsrE family)
MKRTKIFVLVYTLCAAVCAQLGIASDKKLLLVNLTSYTTEESRKAIEYAKAELEQGRPVVVFLNDRGVLAASKVNAASYKEQQRNLTELMKRGATVLVCPDCMKLYGVDPSSLLAGMQIAERHHHS